MNLTINLDFEFWMEYQSYFELLESLVWLESLVFFGDSSSSNGRLRVGIPSVCGKKFPEMPSSLDPALVDSLYLKITILHFLILLGVYSLKAKNWFIEWKWNRIWFQLKAKKNNWILNLILWCNKYHQMHQKLGHSLETIFRYFRYNIMGLKFISYSRRNVVWGVVAIFTLFV